MASNAKTAVASSERLFAIAQSDGWRTPSPLDASTLCLCFLLYLLLLLLLFFLLCGLPAFAALRAAMAE